MGTNNGVQFLNANHVSENPGFLPPEQLDRLADTISRLALINDPDPNHAKHLKDVALGLHRELVDQAADPKSISDIMDAVRALVATTGELEGYPNIERFAKGVADNEQRLVDGLEDPVKEDPKYELRLRRIRTAISFAVLATLEEPKRDVVMGHLRARWLKPSREKALSYLDFERHTPCKNFDANSPVDHLLDLVALGEEPDPRDPALCEEVGYSAKEYLLRRLLTDDERAIALGMKFLKLRHLLEIFTQMPDVLSAGYIGGKATGVILAYAALESDTSDFDREFALKRGFRDTAELDKKIDFKSRLRKNKSTHNGSDVFEQVKAYNKDLGGHVSTLKAKYRDGGTASDELHAQIAKEMADAEFPPHIERHLRMFFRPLHGRPITVRSSSKLEDRLKTSFAGQYESIELTNSSNDFEADFALFKAAILKVYASVFSRKAMEYRKENKLLVHDEEMGLLIQDVNGKQYGIYFYPDVSAVAMSRATQSIGGNPFRGAMRVAFGHGDTIVTNRQGRFVTFAEPHADAVNYDEDPGQTIMTVLNMSTGKKEQKAWQDIEDLAPQVRGGVVNSWERRGDDSVEVKKLNPKALMADDYANIPLLVEYIVQKLKHQLGHDVDCEFTLQYDTKQGDWTINVVQCRPQNIPENLKPSRMPAEVPAERVLLESPRSINGTYCRDVRYVLYINPAVYGENSRHVLGKIRKYVNAVNDVFVRRGKKGEKQYLVISARRFGGVIKDDMAGIPAEFYDFSKAAGFIEVFDKGSNSNPSFGEHFFQLTMDAGMVVGAVKEDDGGRVDRDFFMGAAQVKGIPDVPAEIAEYVKFVDISRAYGKKEEDGGRPSKKKWRVHLAQDNTKVDGGIRMYVAEKGKDYPKLVEEANDEGGDEDELIAV
ncbi:MAG: Phosphoenolpyruvate synthase [Candidatus Peregrinibacteria bacterium GW2011_GWA2_47_7]|nr:MAG: Phosphoenolpyruvate synthase [Candidatus Peregrinibacteria bacterium GW2011_GWA2_47_7]